VLASQQRIEPGGFRQHPVHGVEGDYAATSEVCQTTVDRINARRAVGHRVANAEYIKLDELRNPVFKGTTHMMMLGTNNLKVADVILNWADENIPPKNANGRHKKEPRGGLKASRTTGNP
jgi:hypothetical protein